MSCFGFDHRNFAHAVQFFLDESFLVRMTGEVTANALRTGNTALLIASAEHHEAFARRLKNNGIDVAAHRHNGTYIALDANEILARYIVRGKVEVPNLSRFFHENIRAARAASADKSSNVFVFGELVALLCAQHQFENALMVEQLWDGLVREMPFSLLCAYAIRHFAEAGTETFFPRVCSVHSTVIPPDSYPNSQSERTILQALAASYTNMQD